MRRLINLVASGLRRPINFLIRCLLAMRHMRRLHYSFHLAWIKAAR